MGKIFSGDIKKLDSSKFFKVRIDGKELKGVELKKYVAKKAEGGRTLASIRRALEKGGIKGSQADKRSSILKVIEGGEDKVVSQKAKEKEVIPKWRRARDTSGLEERRAYSTVARESGAKGSNVVDVGGRQSIVSANKNVKGSAKDLGLNAPGASVSASDLSKKPGPGIDAKTPPTKSARPMGF